LGKNKSERWEEEWDEKYVDERLIEKNCRKKNKNFIENISWSETWKEIYHDNDNVSKSCKKILYQNEILIREASWGDILNDEITNKWLRYNYCNNPYEDTKYEYFK
jgi:hypothetical protein